MNLIGLIVAVAGLLLWLVGGFFTVGIVLLAVGVVAMLAVPFGPRL